MKGFEREDLSFSLCGLNCALCTMHLGGYCPGCGGGAGNQGCAIARCSLERGGLEYCFQCEAYPCGKYAHIDEFDSFITHRRQKADLARARELGPAAYGRELREKAELLRLLLDGYNDGRRKAFYCLSVNLLPLPALRRVMEALSEAEALPAKERGQRAVRLLREAAGQCGAELRLRRKK